MVVESLEHDVKSREHGGPRFRVQVWIPGRPPTTSLVGKVSKELGPDPDAAPAVSKQDNFERNGMTSTKPGRKGQQHNRCA